MNSVHKPFSESWCITETIRCQSSGVIVWVSDNESWCKMPRIRGHLKRCATQPQLCAMISILPQEKKKKTSLSVVVKQGVWLQRCDSWANIRAGFTVDPWLCWQLVCCPPHWVLLSMASLVLFAHPLQFWTRRQVRAPEPHIQTQKPFAVLLKQSLLIDENRPSNSLLLIACEHLELGLITENANSTEPCKRVVLSFKEPWWITGDRQLWGFGCCAT